jgi:HEAT repeat protein
MALSEERERVLERTLLLLQLLHPATRLDVVAENFRSDSPARRANAVEVLDNTVRETFKKRLLPLLEDRVAGPRATRSRDAWVASLVTGPRPWIAACAALYAQQAGVASAVGPLETALESPVAYLRESAAQALGRLLPPGASSALERLRDDPSGDVRLAVEGALRLARLGTG